MRQPSGIVVSVLNLARVEQDAENFYINEQKREFNYTPEVNVKAMGRWGVISTTVGYFPINSIGVPHYEPLNKFGSDLSIPFYHYVDDIAITGPLVSRPFTLDLLLACPVIEDVPLEEFIEKCLPISEKNYNFWRNRFTHDEEREGEVDSYAIDNMDTDGEENQEYGESKENKNAEQLKKKVCPTLFTAKQVIKYGKFLVKAKCECKDVSPLVNVTKGICSCGNKKEHSHCSKCGGVL